MCLYLTARSCPKLFMICSMLPYPSYPLKGFTDIYEKKKILSEQEEKKSQSVSSTILSEKPFEGS